MPQERAKPGPQMVRSWVVTTRTEAVGVPSLGCRDPSGPSSVHLLSPPGCGSECCLDGRDGQPASPRGGGRRGGRQVGSLGAPWPWWGRGLLLALHGPLSLACLIRRVIWGLPGGLPTGGQWSSSLETPRQGQEPRKGDGDVFCFWVPWGPRGRLRQAPCREGVNKQQVIKHDKR